MHCAVCGCQDIERLFLKHNYWISACDACSHQFAEICHTSDHVAQVYGDAYFRAGGGGYPDYLNEKEILVRHGGRYARLISRFISPGQLLDVGSAAGFILKEFVKAGWSGTGIEPNCQMADYGRTELALDIRESSVEKFQTDQQYSLITMIQVIAHFYDLRQALLNVTSWTKPGGLVLIETWNKDSWIAKIAKEYWHEYNPPSVLHYFSQRNLERLMSQFGFQQIATGRPQKWISVKHAKSILFFNSKSSKLSSLAAKSIKLIPNQMAILYPAIDLFWALFKKIE